MYGYPTGFGYPNAGYGGVGFIWIIIIIFILFVLVCPGFGFSNECGRDCRRDCRCRD